MMPAASNQANIDKQARDEKVNARKCEDLYTLTLIYTFDLCKAARKASRPPYIKAEKDGGLTAAEMELAMRIFLHFDTNGDGRLNREEMRAIRDVKMKLDLKTVLSNEEFQQAMESFSKSNLADQEMKADLEKVYMQQTIDSGDQNRDGSLDLKEWLLAYEVDLAEHAVVEGSTSGRVYVDRDLRSLEKFWCKAHDVDAHVPESVGGRPV